MIATCQKCGTKGIVEGSLSNGWAFTLVLTRDKQGVIVEKSYGALCPACIGRKEVGLFRTTKKMNAFVGRHPYEAED